MTTNLGDLQRRLRRTLPDAHIAPTVLSGCAGLTLGLINADYQQGPLPREVMNAVIERPAYWAFCWGSGLALARLLTGEPARVTGKRVLDLGSGSGVAAIAAARAGARQVTACDTDPDALAATRCNGELNGVRLELVGDPATLGDDYDLLLMADVLYDRSNLPLLEAAARLARTVLVADSRIRTLPDPAYREIGTAAALTLPNLGEFDEFGLVRFFQRDR